MLARSAVSCAALLATLLLATLLLPAAAPAEGFDPMAPRGGAGGFNPMLPGGAAQPAAPAESDVPTNPELGGIPDTPGAEETYYLCSACHSMSIVTQQRLTDARWDYTWTWMVEQQGMPDMDPETKELILSYLKRHFSSER
jgi:hypothetical protein